MRPDYNAIVIGAGPAGGTAALMLARAGWSVTVVEKRSFPRRKLCGEYLSATSLPVLRELGLRDALRELTGPAVRRGALFAGDAELAFPLPQAAGVWGRAISRERLDHLLLETARRAGATLWQPCTAVALARENGRWTCHLSSRGGSHALTATVVIAASGSWERGPVPVRPQHGHRASDLLAFKAHFRDVDLPDDLMPLVAFPGGYGGLVHSANGGVNLSCCIRRDLLAACRAGTRAPAGEAVLRHIMARVAGARQVMRRAWRDGEWLAAGPIRPGIRRARAEGIFLAGNLAAEAHPIVAEGISMAIQSAWLLSRRLVLRQDELATPGALAATEAEIAAEWRRAFAGRLRAAALFASCAVRPRVVATLLPVLERFPWLLGVGAELSGKAKRIEAAF